MKTKTIARVFKAQPTIEGAGVHLNRVFGNPEMARFADPFLLLDDFPSDDPSKYLAGFPWHPHRGIETITYMLEGSVEHGDSIGNKGIIRSGDVQWMTAGSGIIHQEMPKGDENGCMYGFQLWANLPLSYKMIAPRYREVKASDITEVTLERDVKVRIICGSAGGVDGSVKEIVTNPVYLDISVPPETTYLHPIQNNMTAIAYIFKGNAVFGEEKVEAGNKTGLLFSNGDNIVVSTRDEGVRFLFLSGKPLREPIAWYGPIVMNTEEELRIAFEEYRKGTFIK
jgi:redox-sensitive bicupin YhaK (pirin superfamily)